MDKYKSLDEFATMLWKSLELDTANPVSSFALAFSSKPKGLISKYLRCPKLKVETYSKTEPIWTGTVMFEDTQVPLSQIIDQMVTLTNK